MYKLSVYSFFCCLFFIQALGQDSSKKALQNKPDTEKKQAGAAVKRKSTSDTCCKSIERFKQDLSKMNSSAFRKKYKNKSAKEIVTALNIIINRVISREDSYKINLLDAVMKEPEPNNAKEKPSYAVRLLITDRNSAAGVPLEGTITFDPASNPIPYLNRIKDSSKDLHADLLAYNHGLLIKFNERENTRHLPVQPIMNNTPENGLNAFSKTGTILLLVTGALCCVIGLIAYMRSKSLLKQAEYAAGKNSTRHTRPLVATAPVKDRRAPENTTKHEHSHQPSATPLPDAYKKTPLPANEQATAVAGAPFAPEKKHFFAEIMTTSGPRKKNMSEPGADKDLGEDVCGFVADDKDLLIYLLDGTSDLHCLKDPENNREYFSSRLLAQSIANQLRLSFTANRREAMDVVMLRAIQTVKEDWISTINKLPGKEKSRVRTSIENKSFPECATTLLIGQLSINGQLTVYRSGDSKMFMFRNAPDNKIRFEDTPLVYKNEQSNDRAFFRLVLNANKEFDILYNKPNYEIIQKENMHTVVVFSDGIGMLTEQLLQQQYAMNAEAVRKEIIYQTQGTADDKSICFISISEK